MREYKMDTAYLSSIDIPATSVQLKVVDIREDATTESRVPIRNLYTGNQWPLGWVNFSVSMPEFFHSAFMNALDHAECEISENGELEYIVRIVKVFIAWPYGLRGAEVVADVILEIELIDLLNQQTLAKTTLQHKNSETASTSSDVHTFPIAKKVLTETINEIVAEAVTHKKLIAALNQESIEDRIVTDNTPDDKPRVADAQTPREVQKTGSTQIYAEPSNYRDKTALIIGNEEYTFFPPLSTPVSEAKALAKTLENLGFTVIQHNNLNYEQMIDAIYLFERELRSKKGLAFFHFGGHGVQVDGTNYLIPTDADIPDERRVRSRAISFQEITAAIEASGSSANIMILDACRDNPLPRSTRSGTRGLTTVGRQPPNSVLVYSAEAGTTAMDGVFTPSLIHELENNPTSEFSTILRRVRADVWNQTEGKQRPGEYNQLIEDIFLFDR